MPVPAFHLLFEAESLLSFIAVGLHPPDELACELLRNRSLTLVLPWVCRTIDVFYYITAFT